MKILLIHNHSDNEIRRVPLQLDKIRGSIPMVGLLSLAGYLEKHGHIIKIHDSSVSDEKIEDVLLEFMPDVVGVTTLIQTYPQACHALKIAKDYSFITVLGGHGVELYPEMIDKYYIDYGILGEGEETFLELINVLQSKDLSNLNKIKGLSFKEKGKVITGEPQIVKDLDTIPRPAYHLIDIKKYWSIFNDYPMMTYIVGRGCPYQCNFCIKNKSDEFIRHRSVNLVVDDIEYLILMYKIKDLIFYDDNFTISEDYVRNLCNELISRRIKIKFEAITRVTSLAKDGGVDFLKLLKKAGCYRLRLGVESGDEKILKDMNKQITLKQVELAFKRCEDAGIQTSAFFLIGYLNETKESFNKTLDFAIKLNPHYVAFSVTMPYPNTKLFDQCVDAGLVSKDYWLDYIKGKTRKRIEYLVPDAEERAKIAYKKYYLRFRYIIKSLHHFKRIQYIKNGFRVMFFLINPKIR